MIFVSYAHQACIYLIKKKKKTVMLNIFNFQQPLLKFLVSLFGNCDTLHSKLWFKKKIWRDTLNLPNVTVKKCSSFELTIHQRILKKMYQSFHKHFSTLITYINNIDKKKKKKKYIYYIYIPHQHQTIVLEYEYHVTLKTGVMAAENSALPAQE